MRRPRLPQASADTLEIVEAVPWTCMTVFGMGTAYFAWRGWIPGVRATVALAGLSFVAAGAVHLWRIKVEAAELNAISAAQKARRRMPTGRATVVSLPDHH